MRKKLLFTALSFIATALSTNHLNAQAQLGQSLYGEATSDKFGSDVSCSADGKTIAVSAIENDGNGSNAGQVRVFKLNGNSWEQMGADIDGQAGNDYFGISIGLSSNGTRVIAGSPYNNGGSFLGGSATVYEWNGSSWNKKGSSILGTSTAQYLGEKVAISGDGNVIAVGSRQSMATAVHDEGEIALYTWSGSAWTKRGASIIGPNEYSGIGMDIALSEDGKYVAIGMSNSQATSAGMVKIYQWNGSNYTQFGNTITGVLRDEFGFSVDINKDGNTLVVGAPQTSVSNGKVQVYQYSGGTWTKKGNELTGENNNAKFGNSVKISDNGNVIVVGSPGIIPHGGLGIGATYLYQWNGTSWDSIYTYFQEDFKSAFGQEVACSGDGSIFVASGKASSQIGGEVRVYETSGITSTEKSENINFLVYPNPAREIVSIENFNGVIQILDLQGKLKYNANVNEENTVINVSNWNRGVYFVQLIGETNNVSSFKLIVH